MGRQLLFHLKRHWDILVTLAAAIFSAGIMYSHNTDAIAALTAKTGKLETQVEAISEVKEDVSAIKAKVDLIWDVMQRAK